MAQNKEGIDMNEFTKSLIHGPGGFLDYEDREVIAFQDRDYRIASFVIRALANIHLKDSEKALNAIMDRRDKKRIELTSEIQSMPTFIDGLLYAVQYLVLVRDEPTFAEELMRESGFTKQSFLEHQERIGYYDNRIKEVILSAKLKERESSTFSQITNYK